MKAGNGVHNLIKIAYQAQSPIHFIGDHGIGKSKIVENFGKENGFHVEVLQLTVMEEGDLIGIPTIKDGLTNWAKPVWLQRINDANAKGIPAIIFMDELGRASHGIRQSALQIVLNHKIQEHYLGEVNGIKNLIIVADNPTDDYDVSEFDPALEDRFLTISLEADYETWKKDFAIPNGIHEKVIAFLDENTMHFNNKFSETDKNPTPRAWEKLSDILKVYNSVDPMLYEIIVGKIGKEAGMVFYNFLMDSDTPFSIEDVKNAFENDSLQELIEENRENVGFIIDFFENVKEKLDDRIWKEYFNSLKEEEKQAIIAKMSEDQEFRKFLLRGK